jgi:hypothetical protein
VTAEEAERAGVVIVMESGQARRLELESGVTADRTLIWGDLDPAPITMRRISDPLGNGRSLWRPPPGSTGACMRWWPR